ncbi:MAG: VPLPA-CTERM sorting domain-containing protein [Pseudomonadota bacterium]
MRIFPLRHLLAAALLSVIGVAEASAITFYRTTIDFVPFTGGIRSPDPADGDQVVIDWSTTRTSGIVVASDLVDLRFRLFGQGVLLFDDPFLVNGIAQPIGGVSRSGTALSSSVFSFNLDAFATDPSMGLAFFDNDVDVVQLGAAVGITYNIYDGINERFVNGIFDLAGSTLYNPRVPTTAQSTAITGVIPLPAGLPLMLGGLAVLGIAVRRRRSLGD